jgi:AcrR family transcriptional regulator
MGRISPDPGQGEAVSGETKRMASSPERKRRDAAATRARILKAATQEFSRCGYSGARGDRIARRALSSERMVYYYFGSKEGLFREVLEQVYIELRQAEHSLSLDRAAPEQALDEFCQFVWRYYLDHPEFIGLVNTENLHQGRHLRKSAVLDELVSPVIGILRRLLERGARAGVFRADVDAEQLYLTIAAQGYFYLSNVHTLSAVLGRDLRTTQAMQAHWRASSEVVRRFVAA